MNEIMDILIWHTFKSTVGIMPVCCAARYVGATNENILSTNTISTEAEEFINKITVSCTSNKIFFKKLQINRMDFSKEVHFITGNLVLLVFYYW